ncbi:MAG: hypothetical protein AAB885_01100 [Patescibacteria group bacterium]
MEQPKTEVRRLGVTEVLKEYFGNDEKVAEEIRRVPINERKELAREAAKQLGVELLE